MPEPKAKSITGGKTPEPPLTPSEIVRKLERDSRHKSLAGKAKTSASELDREVSGEYEARQERDVALEAGVDPATAPPHRESQQG